MHIYQKERDLQDENRALAVPGGFEIDKEIAISSTQLSQVRNSFNTTLEYYISNLQFVVIMLLCLLQICLRKNNVLALTSKF